MRSFERCSIGGYFKLSASAASSEFHECVQVGIDVYITHHKYQIKPHSSPWFSATGAAAAIAHRNHFFPLYQRNKSSESKIKFRQVRNHCIRVLEAANLGMLVKQKSLSLPINLALGTFFQIPDSARSKGKSAIPLPFNDTKVLSSASDKAELFC